MNKSQMLTRVDEILSTFPQNRTGVELILRYGGQRELQEKLDTVITMLTQLKTELEGGSNV